MKAAHDGRSTTFAPMLAKCLCADLAAVLSQPLLAQTMRNELAKWAKVVAAAGLKVE